MSQTVTVCSYPQLAARTPLLLLPTVYKFNYSSKVHHWLILMGEEAFALAGVGDSRWTLEPDDQPVSAGPREKRHCTMSDSWQTLWRELWLTVLSCLSSLQLTPPAVHGSHLLQCTVLSSLQLGPETLCLTPWTRRSARTPQVVTFLWLLLGYGLHLHTECREVEDREGETQGALQVHPQHQLSGRLFPALL